MANKVRIDKLLVDNGSYDSRERAKRALMAGKVKVDGVVCLKAGTEVKRESKIEIIKPDIPYVSRGGLKLQAALPYLKNRLSGSVCVDIGASTGGFTDCMLQNGASKVFAIDVGYGQLDWKLRKDERVVNIERTNARYFNPSDLGAPVDLVSIDVSFISLSHILPVARKMIKEDGIIVSLIKPQFEAEKNEVGKNGIIRDKKIHEKVIRKIMGLIEREGLELVKIIPSPVRGAKGNVEFLAIFVNKIHSARCVSTKNLSENDIGDIIKEVLKQV